MADPDLYESLPSSTPLHVSASAGALAGVAEHCVMYPVDSVKTRMQSLTCERQHSTMFRVMSTMIREEGMIRPMRGVSVMALGAGPAHAMYFTALEKNKEFLVNKANMQDHLASGVSAVSATMLHDAVMTPADVVKQRLQMCCSPFSSAIAATATIYNREGIRAFYRSYLTQLTMNIPFQACVVTSYSLCQSLLNPNGEYNPSVHFLSGALSGGLACALTMPLDVCKTLLNTQESAVLKQLGQVEVVGLVNAAKVVHRVTGMHGFFQGLTARVLYQAPSTAVAWSVYEFFKYLMKTNSNITSSSSSDDALPSVPTPDLSASAAASVVAQELQR